MVDNDGLSSRALRGADVLPLGVQGRLAVRASENLDELVSFRARLRTISAGRGLWLLWTWLLFSTGVTFTGIEGSGALIFLGVLLVVLVAVVTYVSRARHRARLADEWLSEVDFRLAQLAARD